MKLWIVETRGWGWEFNIVRAETADDALIFARVCGRAADVTELSPEGASAILWSHDYSPDTPND